MRSGLFWKLFLLQLGAAAAVLAGALLVSRWYSVRTFGEFVEVRERERVRQVAADVAEAYPRAGSLEAAADEVQALQPRRHRLRMKLPPPDAPDAPAPPGAPEAPLPPQPPRSVAPPVPPMHDRMIIRHEHAGPPLQLQDAEGRVVKGDRRPLPEERLAEPIVVDGRTIGFLAWPKFRGRAEHMEIAHREMRHLKVIAPIALLVAALGAALITALIVGPIRRLSLATSALTRREFGVRVAEDRADELGRLARDFNRLAAALEGYDARQRQWLADIAHELRTPLTVLRGELEAMIEGVRPVAPASIRSLREEIGRLERLVHDLQLVALADSGGLRLEVADADVSAIVRDAAARFAARLRSGGFELQLDVAAGLRATVDAQRVDQALANLFQNILVHAQPPGPITVAARRDGQELQISVADAGPGVPVAALPRLFDRLYRVDAARTRPAGGAGLGLSIARSIVEVHGGSIAALRSAAGGLEIRIRLPATS